MKVNLHDTLLQHGVKRRVATNVVRVLKESGHVDEDGLAEREKLLSLKANYVLRFRNFGKAAWSAVECLQLHWAKEDHRKLPPKARKSWGSLLGKTVQAFIRFEGVQFHRVVGFSSTKRCVFLREHAGKPRRCRREDIIITGIEE